MVKKSPNEIVMIARQLSRLSPLDYIDTIFDDFIECHGDRFFGDDQALIGGLAYLNKQPVTILAIQKGRDLQENMKRNFGSPHPEGYQKAYRLMKQAEKFNRPVITFINTPGAFCGIEAEERGAGAAIAKCLMALSDLTVPTIAIFTGEGGSGGALALALTDRIIMLEHSIYSILSPEGFASILWKDASRTKEAADLMKLTAGELKELGVVDKVVLETNKDIPLASNYIMANLKRTVVKELSVLQTLSLEDLHEQRYAKYRKF
ncbi:acetyl-CoA carboxylase carboxyl transferase subunit alpha [Vagococcus sp. PNs007]|uniref:acetyl-CoA carboxytransferase n=1 Tax=Vagococcus proximus TaxID=2991417 RepID=A0ABT5X272_9ENTE|nr:acetyl-CoA carboxylase carboxyl transferase subunit alpha [Vagococcus proximus]MDF0480027.1 acetyl-CoA carboxylase carboxyl transferase subunit alpha [Vagococcus proximus]